MDASATSPLLRLIGIERQFEVGGQSFPVLKGVSLEIKAGELVAITGQSGSGKSTLMNILGCLDRPNAGEYWINGVLASTMGWDELAQQRRQQFGFVFQRYHLLPHLTASENVQVPAVYSGVSPDRRREVADGLLRRLGLSERVDFRPTQLSGGQQQRVSIARALMNGGSVILADEPTGALDAQSGAEVLAILLELNKLGHTVILVTHDPLVARHACRVLEMRGGRIFEDRSASMLSPCELQTQTTEISAQETMSRQARVSLPCASSANVATFGEAVRTAWISLTTHYMRTFLTMLGIIIGIMSVVTVIALGQGAQRSVIRDIEAIGTNTIDIRPGRDWGDENANTIRTLNSGDVSLLRGQFYIDSVTPNIFATQNLVHSNVKASASIVGVGDEYFRVMGLRLATGRFFDEAAIRRHAQVVVIDDNTRKRLFKSWEDPVGRTIMLGTLPVAVIGVIEKRDYLLGESAQLTVYAPYTTVGDKIKGQSWFDGITVRVRKDVPSRIAEQSLSRTLIARHGIKDFFTHSSDSVVRTVEKATGTLTLLILGVAVVSLLVGGIGVMNIMLVSVSERTHEIGIRIAVGARQRDIMQQFIVESVLVCLVGGAFGILLSFAASEIFSMFVTMISMQFSFSAIAGAFACSTLIGVAFGFWPARNAARLDPVVALARE